MERMPLGENSLRNILHGIVAQGDAEENDALEAKSDIDPSQKGLGIAKIAKFILGMANRSVEVAHRHFDGYGILVIGARKGECPGVPGGIEEHQMADRLRPYLGIPGPAWQLRRLSVGDREVLFIVVGPPQNGQSPFPCRKDFQSSGPDRKSDLADGDLYIRDRSQTRKAKSHEIDALVERALAGFQPKVEIQFTGSSQTGV